MSYFNSAARGECIRVLVPVLVPVSPEDSANLSGGTGRRELGEEGIIQPRYVILCLPYTAPQSRTVLSTLRSAYRRGIGIDILP